MIYKNPNYHSFEKRKKYFLFGIENLAVCQISNISYDLLNYNFPCSERNVIRELSQYSSTELKNSLEELREWGIIVDHKIINTNQPHQNPFKNNVEDKTPKVNGLYLVISQDCNLRCKYCSADYGRFGRKVPKNLKLMSKNTMRKSINYLIANMEPTMKEPPITFVGGEPLMNFEIIKETVEYCRSKTNLKIRFALNTNGTLMTNSIAEWFSKNDVDVRFSIDGTREIHNQNRCFLDGYGSYDKAIEGLKVYLSNGKQNFSIQASIPHGKDLIKSVKNLWSLGATMVMPNFTAESAYLDTECFRMNDNDYKTYLFQWEQLNDSVIESIKKYNRSPFMHLTAAYLETLHLRRRRNLGCGVGRTVSITPDEKIYICQGIVGDDNYSIGDLSQGIDSKKLEKFGDLYAQYLDKCNNCWARNICGVNCVTQSIQYNELGEEYEPSRLCWLAKKSIEYTIYFYYKLKVECGDTLNMLVPKAQIS